jgi:hypothetical protein
MDINHGYYEYYVAFDQESLLFVSALYSCFFHNNNKKFKKYKLPMLYSDRLYLTACNISCLRCAIAAVPPNCSATSRFHTPLGTAVQLMQHRMF